jgi:large subunit ribosomal protein L24
MALKIKTGDKVRIIAGKDKGKEGKVIQVFPKLQKVVVEGLNMATRHLRSQRRGQAGQKIQFPAPVHISNVKLVSAKSGQSGRVGSKVLETEAGKKKIRVIKFKGTTEDIE